MAYLGSLAVLFVAAFWRLDPFTSQVVHEYGTQNFQQIAESGTYRTIAFRTIGIAFAVTVADVLLAFPIALYMAKLARPRVRNLMVVAVLVPLWSSYLVKVYAWRTILSTDGILNWFLGPVRAVVAGLRDVRDVAGLHVPVAAVHGDPDLRGPGAIAGLDAGRLG